jgi:hypothetical protein
VFGGFGISQKLIDTFDPEELRVHAHRRESAAKTLSRAARLRNAVVVSFSRR